MPSSRSRPFYKVIIIGSSNVGKTALLERFVNHTFTKQFKATIGADFLVKEIEMEDESRVTLQLWDTAGTERFAATSPSFETLKSLNGRVVSIS